MARFYASCLSYARKRPSMRASSVLGRMGLNESSWIGFSSLQQLFDHVVSASFDTGLAGVVRVGKSAVDGRLVVDVGESLRSTLGDQTTSFLRVTLRELGWRKNLSLVAAIGNLDAGVETARNGGKVSAPSSVINVMENGATPTPSLTWAEALNQPFSSPNGSNNVAGAFVTARAQDAMKATTTLLAQVDLKVAGLYSLLVMLAQVMKYPYLLATNFASFEDVSLCLQATGEHMEGHFTSWLARSLEDGGVPTYLDAMVAALNRAIERSTWLNDNLAVNLADVTERLVVKRAGVVSEDCVSEDTMAPGQAPGIDYNDDFLANILLAHKMAASCLRVDVVANRTAATIIPQLEGLITHGPADALVVPTAVVTPDLLHVDAREPSLDYSTLGVMLLVEWAHAVSDRRPELAKRLHEYAQCIRKDAASLLLANNVTDASLRTIVFLPWALDLALAAARSQWRANDRVRNLEGTTSAGDIPPVESVATDRLRVQLFFRRFCQTTCGDKEAAKICAYGVLRSGQFAKAFQCTWPDTDADC